MTKVQNTTFNIAPVNWRQRVMKDVFLTAERRQTKLAMIEDYIGRDPTR